MSSSIWTECGGASELRPLRLEPWRVVEGQHQISTRKLVETDAEQGLLEELIDAVKPPDLAGRRLHYLLSTPFRYPPLRHGSRFGARHDRGVWYGSETLEGAFAEVVLGILPLITVGAGWNVGEGPTGIGVIVDRIEICAPRGGEVDAALAGGEIFE